MMTIAELMADSDWAQVFADENAGNVSKHTETVGACPADPPPTRADVVEILAICSPEHEEGWDGEGVFRLRDGRYLYAEGRCDYTGWS